MNSPTVFSDKHPPKNRHIRPGLGVIDLVIRDANGEWRTDPNGAVLAAHRESLTLGEPVGASDISGQPGYAYETSEITLTLTRDELYRLLRRNLRPAEYFELVRKFGVFFELHDDFYEPATGMAMQGHLSATEQDTFVWRCVRAEAAPEDIDQYVAAWHDGAGKGQPLHEFLGLTWSEYDSWVREPLTLHRTILALTQGPQPEGA